MNPTLFDNTTIPALQEVIGFAQARHTLLAGNIANADTPGYQTRDLSVETFQTRLKEAIEAQHTRNEQLSPGMIDDPHDDPMHEVKDSLKHILFHDGTDVSMEQQITQMSKNQFMHNLAISIMSSQFRMLQTAITERV